MTPDDDAGAASALLNALAPKRWAAQLKAEQAKAELSAQYGIGEPEIRAILFPSGEPSILVQLAKLTEAKSRRVLIGLLNGAATRRIFSDDERRRFRELADELAATTPTDLEINEHAARLGLNQPGRMFVPNEAWLDLSVEWDTDLSRAGIVGERCVQLYRLLAERIPPQRGQRLGRTTTRYNTRAMDYTAALVSGAYGWYGMKPVNRARVAAHLARRLKER
jgi:hypothetical protein